MPEECTHLDQIKVRETKKHACEECVKLGDTWVHLRMCLTCGQIGCCDSSKNKHATKHFHKSQHALMRSIEPGERWMWCYIDELVPGDLAA
jgi:uncharacterized UBP type Zn finger protein